MEPTNHGGTPAAHEPASDDHAWETFEVRLAAYLATMIDPSEEDHLLLQLPQTGDPDDGCTPYAQFAAFGDGRMLRAEISGDGYLAPQWHLGQDGTEFLRDAEWSGNDETETNWYVEVPVDHADAVANHVTWAFRNCFGVALPDLLTQESWGPAASAAEALGLCASDAVPEDVASSRDGHESVIHQLAITPDDRDHLHHLVQTFLCEKYETDVEADDDGDFVLFHLGQMVWVRVRQDQPTVEIMARVVHDVRSRRATAVELSLLNRDNLWTRWTLRDRSVWMTLAVPANPFVPAHLFAMLDLFRDSMTAERDDLVLRSGGKVA